MKGRRASLPSSSDQPTITDEFSSWPPSSSAPASSPVRPLLPPPPPTSTLADARCVRLCLFCLFACFSPSPTSRPMPSGARPTKPARLINERAFQASPSTLNGRGFVHLASHWLRGSYRGRAGAPPPHPNRPTGLQSALPRDSQERRWYASLPGASPCSRCADLSGVPGTTLLQSMFCQVSPRSGRGPWPELKLTSVTLSPLPPTPIVQPLTRSLTGPGRGAISTSSLLIDSVWSDVSLPRPVQIHVANDLSVPSISCRPRLRVDRD